LSLQFYDQPLWLSTWGGQTLGRNQDGQKAFNSGNQGSRHNALAGGFFWYLMGSVCMKGAVLAGKKKKITDRDKLITIGTMLGCQVVAKEKILVLAGRRYSFNNQEEIVKIQDIVHSPTKGYKYRTLAEA